MQSLGSQDVNSAAQQVSNGIKSLKTYSEISAAEKALSQAGNSATEAANDITSQLDQIKDLQKRYLREPPNSMDQLLNFLGQTRGQGSETLRFLRKKLLEAAAKMGPRIEAILKDEAMKALGCSQEQTYKGKSAKSLKIQPLPQIPTSPLDGFLYIPVQSVDFFSNLKYTPTSKFGKFFYEKPEPVASPDFRPFGGLVDFPMNKQLYQLMEGQNKGRSLSTLLGVDYQGVSGQPLFDVQYVNTNNKGIDGDFFRVAVINREDVTGGTLNQVGTFISDYYSTVKIADNVNIGAHLANLVSGAVDIQRSLGYAELNNQTRFFLIIQRILGLCFDSRREIDVSGNAKVGELDGVDESFFYFTEIDLRNIDVQISNVQNGIIEFEDCDNLKLPVDAENIVEQLVQMRSFTAQTVQQQVETIEQILDSITQNPEWNLNIPSSVNVNLSINTKIIKKIPIAVAAAILTPKVLLPIFTMMALTQSAATFTYNQIVTSANTFINSANTFINSANTFIQSGTSIANSIGQEGSNIINNAVDFTQKWKTFTINIVSTINAEFLKILYDLLKKDILRLVDVLITDVEKSKKLAKYAMIARLLEIVVVVALINRDYKRCKSLLNNLLLLINSVGKLVNPGGDPPLPLLALAGSLPGFSPERAMSGFIEKLQKLGLPTGPMPDGSPNKFMIAQKQVFSSYYEEWVKNSKSKGVTAGVGASFTWGKSW